MKIYFSYIKARKDYKLDYKITLIININNNKKRKQLFYVFTYI